MSVYYYNLYQDAATGRNKDLKNYLEGNFKNLENYSIKEIILHMINNWHEVERWV